MYLFKPCVLLWSMMGVVVGCQLFFPPASQEMELFIRGLGKKPNYNRQKLRFGKCFLLFLEDPDDLRKILRVKL